MQKKNNVTLTTDVNQGMYYIYNNENKKIKW